MMNDVTAGRKKVVVLISGGGSNMLSLAKAAAEPGFPAEIVAVIADKADAGGLAKAAALGIPTYAFLRKDFDSKDAHEAAVLAELERLSPDIICLAGYMRLLSANFIQRHEGRIINIHPSLLPLFRSLSDKTVRRLGRNDLKLLCVLASAQTCCANEHSRLNRMTKSEGSFLARL